MTPSPEPAEVISDRHVHWYRLYGIVLGELALLILLFHLFGRVFR